MSNLNKNVFVRPIAKSQLLMELNLNEFINNNVVVDIPKKFSLNNYSKDLDKSLIILLNLGEFDPVWDSDSFTKFMSSVKRQIGSKVILNNNEAIAATFASASIHENEEVGRLDFVVTHPKHRGKGLGKNICAAVIKYFIENNYKKVILQTDDWRIPAIAVYLKLGFKPVFINKQSEKRWNKIINNYFKI